MLEVALVGCSDTDLGDAGVGNDGAVLEEDEGVELHAGAAGHLCIPVADVEVVGHLVQLVPVARVLRQLTQPKRSCQEPVHHHIRIPDAKTGQ